MLKAEIRRDPKQDFALLWCTKERAAVAEDTAVPNEPSAPPTLAPVAKTEQQEKGIDKVVVDEKGFGKVTVDGVNMTFIMGEAYDPKDEFPDDEPNFTSVRKIALRDDRGTFLAAVEKFEMACRSDQYAMNVDLDKFKKLKADWLKKSATAANYKKASKEFKSIRIRSIEDRAPSDFEWESVCDEVNQYVMELKIYKHLPDPSWAKYEAKEPAWMSDELSGTYPYIDQVKFIAYKVRLIYFCSSAPKMDQDNWRLTRDSRLQFTINTANAEQTKDINHYLALMHEAKQRIEWKQARDGDLAHLARVCREYEALVSNVNTNTAPAKNLPMDKIASLYLVGVALRDVQCSAGATVVRNALEFARQNGKTEDDVRTFAMANKAEQLKALTPSVEWSRNAGAMERSLSEFCQIAISSDRFLGLPNRH